MALTTPRGSTDSVYDTVQDMKDSKRIKLGDRVSVNGYEVSGDGGRAYYLVVEAGTGVDDGGSYHDLTGTGLQAQLIADPYVNPRQFGAKGDGSEDATDSLTRFFSSELPLEFVSGDTYRIDGAVSVSDKNIWLADSAGATVLVNSDTAQLNFTYNYTDEQAVSAVDNTASIDMSEGTTFTLTPCTKLTVSDGSAYSAGDSVKVVCDDRLWGTGTTENEKAGEHAIIYSVDGNDIYLDKRLVANDGAYNTNVRIAKSSPKECVLGSFSIDGDAASKVNRVVSHLVVIGCANLRTTGCIRAKDTQATVFNIRSCNRPYIDTVYAQDGVTDKGVGAFAHCLLFTCGTTNFHVNAVNGRNMRHLVDTTAVSASSIDSYGGVVGGYAASIFGIGMQGAAASTHNDADNIRFGEVVNVNPIHGVDGGMCCVGFRGRNCHVDYVDSDEGNAVYAFTDRSVADNSRGHSAGKIVMRGRGLINRSRAVLIIGNSSSPVDLTVGEIHWHSLRDNNISVISSVTYGDVYVNQVFARGGSESNSIELLEVDVAGHIEIESFVGRDLGTHSLCSFQDPDSSIKIKRIDVEAGTTWGYLARMRNHDATFYVGEATFDTRGTDADLILSRGTGADTQVDWVVLDQENSPKFNRKRLSTITADSATGTYNIDVSDIGAEVMYQKVIGTVTGAAIKQVSDGLFLGQELVISNNFDSTGDLDIDDDANGIRLNATVTLQPSESLRALWNGFEWVRA